MPIYTRTGDTGTTGTATGKRVLKSSLEIEVGGCIDELSTFLGLARVGQTDETIKSQLLDVQKSLLVLGSDVAIGTSQLSAADVKQIEQAIDQYSQIVPPLREFVIPGDNHASATLHVARTVCRRTERILVQFNEMRKAESQPFLSPCIMQFLNRLSDLLFVFARVTGGESFAGESKSYIKI